MKDLLKIFKALSDPIRLRILHLLFHGEHCVCDLVLILNLPQSTISRHLANLKASGLITSRKSGLWNYYKLNIDSEHKNKVLAMVKESEDPIFTADVSRLQSTTTCIPDANGVCSC